MGSKPPSPLRIIDDLDVEHEEMVLLTTFVVKMVQGFSYEFAAIEQVGAQVRFLPPYSGGLQPHRTRLRQTKRFSRDASPHLWPSLLQLRYPPSQLAVSQDPLI